MATNNSAPAPDETPIESYIPPETTLREFTPRALILGTILGVIFGASSLYLVLKVGLTVSASIPVAVISLALFRVWGKFGQILYPYMLLVGCFLLIPITIYLGRERGISLFISAPIGALLGGILNWLILKFTKRPAFRDSTILENNIVQTAGSAGESVAFGLGVTMPAIMILGFDLEITRIMLVAALGGALGILMMIPLRRALIVQQHKELKYPEGTACAEVLKAGANAESRAAASESARATHGTDTDSPSGAVIFTGFGIGLLYKTLMSALKLWKDTPEKIFGAPLKGGSLAAEISPELLGVGYIIGPRISCIMMAGGVVGYLLLIPLIKFFGDALTTVVPPGKMLISEMGPSEIRGAYLLYIGAGAVAAGGIISLFRSLPTILHGIRAGLSDFKRAASAHASLIRTERDISMKTVAVGIVALVIAILVAPPLHMNIIGALLIVVFGFLFVTVSSRLTGEIGSSSNPISGMTVATLLLTCLIFVIVGWTGGTYYVTALSVGGIVCIAASNGGTTSQDLKTGFLVGGTPRLQQMAILIGATAGALALGPVLLKLNDAATVYVPAAKIAPGLHAPLAQIEATPREKITGPQAKDDAHTYATWHKTDETGGPAGKYLVEENGRAVWFVDPGINGVHKVRPGGEEVHKFDAPKATLMSYIIKGILDQKLPWALVLFGVMISVVLELCGVSSLAFAVGVYLPISSSAPVFVGGIIRWLVDRYVRRKHQGKKLTEEQLVAEGDKSSGVLLASGYIAGGAIAGIIIAFAAGVATDFDKRVTDWATANNPFFTGANADWMALVPFIALTTLLYLVGRECLFAPKRKTV